MEEKRTARGRPRLGSPNPNKAVKFSTSLPPDLFARLVKYCEDEERDSHKDEVVDLGEQSGND